MRCGMGVRQGGTAAGGDDGVEGRLFRAQHFHLIFDLGGDVQFADAGADALEDAGIGFGVED